MLFYCHSLSFSQTLESVYYSFGGGGGTNGSTPTFSQTTVINHVLLVEGAGSAGALPVAVLLVFEYILLSNVTCSQFEYASVLGLRELFLPYFHHFTGSALSSSC